MKTPVLVTMALAAASSAAAPTPAASCLPGAYRTQVGELVVLSPVDDGSLRYRLMDGRSGRLYPGDRGFEAGPGWSGKPPPIAARLEGACPGPLRFAIGETSPANLRRVDLQVRETTFESGGTKLAGRLLLPKTSRAVPILVLLHGSERTSARERDAFQHLMPANGIGVFVFDKRGTGASDGAYTQDFDVLARDAAAAVTEARRLTGRRLSTIGVWGPSQGGWVAPLVAGQVPLDFVMVGYGMAVSPIQEDHNEVLFELKKRGYGGDVLRKAAEVAKAAGDVMVSNFTHGFDRLEAVKAKYGGEPWFKDIAGEYTSQILQYPEPVLREVGPKQVQGTPWRYDPLPALRAVRQPMLWVLGGDDDEAPSDDTVTILRRLQAERPALDVVVYPKATHGIIRVEERPPAAPGAHVAPERVQVGHEPGYFPLLVNWIKMRSVKAGPEAVVYRPPASHRR